MSIQHFKRQGFDMSIQFCDGGFDLSMQHFVRKGLIYNILKGRDLICQYNFAMEGFIRQYNIL